MSEPFLAEVKIFGFNFAPRGWAQCDGQILPINQNQSLYSLLGTVYGGDGRTSFGLPDLRGRTCLHVDASYPQGQKGGQETHVLTVPEIPSHDHPLHAYSADATVNPNQPAGNLWAKATASTYHTLSPTSASKLSANAVGNAGNSQGHENMEPFTTLNFCIATQGLFPSRN
ncbi:phage tail protein [Novipirellula sp. SH528]|uniref:phage tail protein n=1 Tax=Novipirellula sp. SH528 TaxID=3454466 RepID=UPI003F9FD9D9